MSLFKEKAWLEQALKRARGRISPYAVRGEPFDELRTGLSDHEPPRDALGMCGLSPFDRLRANGWQATGPGWSRCSNLPSRGEDGGTAAKAERRLS